MSNGFPYWPRIEHVRDGTTTVVDSLMIAFFLDRERCADPAPAQAVLAGFLAGPARGRLRFYVDDEGYTAPLPEDPAPLLSTATAGSLARGEVTDVQLLDREQPGHRFQARYLHDPGAPNPRWPDKRSFLWLRVEQEVLAEGGLEAMLAFVDAAAARLPYSYGYVHPALAYGQFFADVLPYTRRYPGFDVVSQAAASSDVDDRVLGAYWINFLGPRLSDALGGTDALRRALPDAARVTPAGRGTRIMLGDTPDVGDVNRGDDLPLYRRAAEVLRPRLHVPRVVYFKDQGGMADPEAQERWHHRFLADQPLAASDTSPPEPADDGSGEPPF